MPSNPLSATFAALAEPTRESIPARRVTGETSVKALAEPFALSAPVEADLVVTRVLNAPRALVY